MHSELLTSATHMQLKEFTSDILAMLKVTNKDLYESLEWHLYCQIYGCHFSDFLLEKALNDMINSDGTTGKHWTLEQTDQCAKQLGVTFINYNRYDWCYVMNMKFSDESSVLGISDTMMYAKLAKLFLEDIDGPEGKALKYYIAMKDSKSPGDFNI